MINPSEVLKNCQKNLDRNRAVATGIGVFARIINSERKVLLRRRKEKDSLFNEDLSGKWELPGGGVEISDFSEEDYRSAVISTLERELMEEVGLELLCPCLQVVLRPAWLGKDGQIDLAFVVDMPKDITAETPAFKEMIANNEIRWFTWQEAHELEFISKRMKFMILSFFF
ncbi:MAG: NUDIX hydrolase [Minisyncoccales bacterium]